MRFASLLVLLCLPLGLGAGTPGTLRYGAVPAGAGTRPVLLFVHGWNSDATTWSGSNDMEAKAVAAGYRTAFLDVYADRAMWDNGPLIAGAVDQVKVHFAGAGVVLVCHSKGGVDGQTAEPPLPSPRLGPLSGPSTRCEPRPRWPLCGA